MDTKDAVNCITIQCKQKMNSEFHDMLDGSCFRLCLQVPRPFPKTEHL
jgi:hypothetical protein